MTPRLKALLVCSDAAERRALKRVLHEAGIAAACCSTVREARQRLAQRSLPLVFCESSLSDGSYRELLGAPERVGSKIAVVVTSHTEDAGQYLEAMGLGAFDYMASPFRRSELEWIVSHLDRAA